MDEDLCFLFLYEMICCKFGYFVQYYVFGIIQPFTIEKLNHSKPPLLNHYLAFCPKSMVLYPSGLKLLKVVALMSEL